MSSINGRPARRGTWGSPGGCRTTGGRATPVVGRGALVSAKAIKLPTWAASSRMARIRASGAKGLPFSIPICASSAASSRLIASRARSPPSPRGPRSSGCRSDGSCRRTGPCHRCGGSAARASTGQGRDPRAAQVLARRGRVAAGAHEGAKDEPLAVRAQRGSSRRSPSAGQVAFVARRHEQVPTALAMVGPDDAQVAHGSHPLVVQEPEHPRRHVQHDRAGLGVDHGDAVDRLGVAGQGEPVGVRVEHQDVRRPHVQVRVKACWNPHMAAAIRCRRNTWQPRWKSSWS